MSADDPSDRRDLPENRSSEGRDASGKFARGNKHGRGNPKLRRLAEAQQAVRDASTPDTIRAVLEAMAARAIAGDPQAGRVYLDRTLGRPGVEPSGVSIPLPAVLDMAGIAQATRDIAAAAAAGELPAQDAAVLLNALQACVQLDAGRKLEERLRAIEERGGQF